MLVVNRSRSLVTGCCRCLQNESSQTLIKSKIQSKTGSIIVTGDEVLKGQVFDSNSHFLCKELYKMGIEVMAVSKVGDDVDIISEEVKKFSQKFNYVLTTGGIGPTHDDVTYEAIAKAFNDKLHYHPELTKLVLKFYKTNEMNHPALKMAYIPTKAKLTYGFDTITQRNSLYPTISVENVFIYPGVPHFCKRLFSLTKDKLFVSSGKFYSRELYLTQNESLIVHNLNNAVNKFKNVKFGSYPELFHSYYNVKITIQSHKEVEVNEAFEYLKNSIPKQFHTEYDKNSLSNKINKLMQFKDEFLMNTIDQLENLLKNKSNINDVFVYFDGGKNSTVLLYIVSALFEKLHPKAQINAVYVEINPKVTKFVRQCVEDYQLNLLKLHEHHFINFMKSNKEFIVIKGIRKTDPKASLTTKIFEDVNLINPMWDWSYNDVWRIIRNLYLPYCELYDQGYTSVNQINSGLNPHLLTTGPRSDIDYYKKAYELSNETLEYVVK